MIKQYNKIEFEKLGFDIRSEIIEQLLPMEFYEGQEKYMILPPPNWNPDSEQLWNLTEAEEKQEEEGFVNLISELSDRLFDIFPEISFDIESLQEDNS